MKQFPWQKLFASINAGVLAGLCAPGPDLNTTKCGVAAALLVWFALGYLREDVA